MKANPDCKTEQFFTHCEQFADITKPRVVSFPSEMSNQWDRTEPEWVKSKVTEEIRVSGSTLSLIIQELKAPNGKHSSRCLVLIHLSQWDDSIMYNYN